MLMRVIHAQVKNVCKAGLAALKKEAKELKEALSDLKYDPVVISPDQGVSTLDRMLCSLNNDLSPQVTPSYSSFIYQHNAIHPHALDETTPEVKGCYFEGQQPTEVKITRLLAPAI